MSDTTRMSKEQNDDNQKTNIKYNIAMGLSPEEIESIKGEADGKFLSYPDDSAGLLRAGYILGVTAEREKAKELAQAFKSLMDEIDARGYSNDFTKQRAILDNYSKSIDNGI